MTRLSGPERVALVACLVFALYVWAVTIAQATSMRAHDYELSISPEMAADAYERIESGEVEGW